MSSGTAEDAAFKELFETFFDDLKKVAWRITGRPDVAEDLCQEAFIRYYERRQRLPGGDEGRYWLIRVVKNLAFNYEKRQGREREAYRNFSLQPKRVPKNEGESAVLAEESLLAVREALLDVPYKLRIALILKEYGDYTYADIGKILRITEGNVKVRVFRARQHLAGRLNKGDVHVP